MYIYTYSYIFYIFYIVIEDQIYIYIYICVNEHDKTKLTHPTRQPDAVKATCDTFTLATFTAADAWELGHLLYARLLPLSAAQPTVISIATAQGHVLFQAAAGAGTTPDNDAWVRRKRGAVLRFGVSSWFLQCRFAGDEGAFRRKFGFGEEKAGEYAIHGGGVPSMFIFSLCFFFFFFFFLVLSKSGYSPDGGRLLR